MNTIFWLVAGLATFDSVLLILFYVSFRNHAPLDQKGLYAVGAGMAGFVVHAIMFFSGAFLILQLATIAGIFGIVAWAPRKARKGNG